MDDIAKFKLLVATGPPPVLQKPRALEVGMEKTKSKVLLVQKEEVPVDKSPCSADDESAPATPPHDCSTAEPSPAATPPNELQEEAGQEEPEAESRAKKSEVEQEHSHNSDKEEEGSPAQKHRDSSITERNSRPSSSTSSRRNSPEHRRAAPLPQAARSGSSRSGVSPSPRNPTLPSRHLVEQQTQRTPRIGAFRVSAPREAEVQMSERTFLKRDDRSTGEFWWHSLAPPLTAFKPATNQIPVNTTRRINNASKEDNVWQHLYESGLDGEKRKLFQASPDSFRQVSKMWEGGFKEHGAENRREVTVPGMAHSIGWDRSVRADFASNNRATRNKKVLAMEKDLEGINQAALSRNGGYEVEPLPSKNPKPTRRRAMSGEPAQPNRSPWYQKSAEENRKISSRYLLSSGRSFRKEGSYGQPAGRSASSTNLALACRSDKPVFSREAVLMEDPPQRRTRFAGDDHSQKSAGQGGGDCTNPPATSLASV